MPHFYPPTPIPVNEIRSGLEHFVQFSVRGANGIAQQGREVGERVRRCRRIGPMGLIGLMG
jgi:hypothetical protein